MIQTGVDFSLNRINLLYWPLVPGKINAFGVFQRRKPFIFILRHWCVMCMENTESVHHLFLHFDVTSQLWSKLLGELNLEWLCPRSFADLFRQEFVSKCKMEMKILWHIEMLELVWLWTIWLERNKAVLEGIDEMLSLCEKLKYWGSLSVLQLRNLRISLFGNFPGLVSSVSVMISLFVFILVYWTTSCLKLQICNHFVI